MVKISCTPYRPSYNLVNISGYLRVMSHRPEVPLPPQPNGVPVNTTVGGVTNFKIDIKEKELDLVKRLDKRQEDKCRLIILKLTTFRKNKI